MKLLIGNTGLVGQTIQKFDHFDHGFNSRNINEVKDVKKNGDELFLSCLPATKWLVNQDLSEDINNIYRILETLKGTNYSKITLISTIDVYNDSPLRVNENYAPNVKKLSYGNNRYIFELLITECLNYENLKIFRLPAIFNNLIKKNILFDLINNNNVDRINSNSFYQWYNLDNLHKDINKFSTEYPDQTLFNLFTEPVFTLDILKLFPEHKNKIKFGEKLTYDYRTVFGEYIENKENVLKEIQKFKNEFSFK